MLGFTNPFRQDRKSFDFDAWKALIDFGAETAAGILTTPRRAFDSTPFALGVDVRKIIATLPIKLYQRDGDAAIEASDHPLYRLLKDRPNAWTSAVQFIGDLEQDCILHGHGYAFANRVDGRIFELIHLDPLCVTVKRNVLTWEPIYEVSLQNGAIETYRWQDILHVQTSNGLAPAKTAREAIGLAIALERHASKILGNGARPSGVLKAKNKLNDTAFERLKKSWRSQHSGEGAGGTAILEDGVEFEALTFSSVDLQFNEMRQFQILEIGRALGIPPTLLFELGRATWANSESLGESFLTYTMLPRCKLWEGAISRLLTEDEQKIYFPEFLTEALVRADLASRYEAYAKACGGPWLVPDEVRSIDNRGPIEGGDKLRPPANAVGVGATPPATRPKPALVSA